MHCLGIIILLNLNQIHAMTYTGCIFIFPLNNTSAIVWADLCIWGYWHTSEKPKIFCIEMNFFETTCESLHMFVGSWVLWPNLKHYFKLVHATIWRNGFQPKHLINSEWRWPCLRAATWKCWTTDKAKTSVLATRPGLCPFPSGHDNTRSYFYHPLVPSYCTPYGDRQ